MIRIGESITSKILIFHLQVLGVWCPEKFSMFYFFYSALLYIIFTLIYVLCMCINFAFLTSLNETIHSVYVTFTCVALLFKSLNFLWYNRDMQNHLKIINDFKLQNDFENDYVRKRLKIFRNVWFCYYLMVNAAGIAGYLNVLFTLPRVLPFRAWYPFDWKHNENIYWLTYAYQVVGMIVYLANLNIAIEVFPGYLIYMASLKMDILALRLHGIGKNLKLSNAKLFNNKDNEQQKSMEILVDCIKVHQDIVKFTNRIEKNFSVAYFAQICLSGVIICSVTYALTTTSPREGVAEFSFYVVFLVALVTQIFLPCYLGNEVIFTSESLLNSSYNSSWHLMSLNYRKLLLIFMEHLKKRSQILVGKLFPLSLDTFTSIIYFAYRLYAVISSTKSN